MDKRPILIVEHDNSFAKMLDQELGHNGFKVHLADSAKEALRLFEKISPEAVITEVQLRDMNGLDLLENLKNKSISVPVILMTGGGKVSDAVEAMRKGAEDYLLKPFAMDRLEAVIHRALSENPANVRQEEASSSIPPFGGSIITRNRR
ncbi:MAG: sigma-54-dependent Fis family transcriptional regulator, partial [Deltaproteobacteria bacterium]|nr:sigma-54-dependent Fis family transcriptional regulator [Deltaproteobacteria bacterium]